MPDCRHSPAQPHKLLTPANAHMLVIPANAHMLVIPANAHMLVIPANAHMLVIPANAHMLVIPTNAHMLVIPAEAGIQLLLFAPVTKNWIPDCRCAASGMTVRFVSPVCLPPSALRAPSPAGGRRGCRRRWHPGARLRSCNRGGARGCASPGMTEILMLVIPAQAGIQLLFVALVGRTGFRSAAARHPE